jgi:hypothetical protein
MHLHCYHYIGIKLKFKNFHFNKISYCAVLKICIQILNYMRTEFLSQNAEQPSES